MMNDRRTLDDYGDGALLTAPETAEVLRISRDKVYELIHRGELPAIHLGRMIRVPAFGLRQWIATQAGVSAPAASISIISRQSH
jgi:putative molybdopterin biosynthesis protein